MDIDIDFENNVDESHLNKVMSAMQSAKDAIRGHRRFCIDKVKRGKAKLREDGEDVIFNEFTHRNEKAEGKFSYALEMLDEAIENIGEAMDAVQQGNQFKDAHRDKVKIAVVKKELWYMGEDADEIQANMENLAAAGAGVTAAVDDSNPNTRRVPFGGIGRM